MDRHDLLDKGALIFLQRRSRPALVVITLALVGAVGLADYLTGFERSLLVFYLIPLAAAAWFVGRFFVVVISLMSVASWVGGDVAAGAHYSSVSVVIWNSLIELIFFLVVGWLLVTLRFLLSELEQRVERRTAALEREAAARARLEQEMAEVTERERQRLGHELHDSLCQHLTATALAAQVMGGQLPSDPVAQSAAAEVIGLIEAAIDLTRDLARGLISFELEGEGLCSALCELARDTTKRSSVECTCRCTPDLRVRDSLTATHLFRIAQEAVNNASRHSRGDRISIECHGDDAGVVLKIEDNGIGVSSKKADKHMGLGLRIMAHRSGLIGATFAAERAPSGGTAVICRLAQSNDQFIPAIERGAS